MSQRLLLADRDILEVEKISSILREDYEVFVAYNGRSAYAIIENEKIDMVFADVNMVLPDGKSLLLKIKENFPNITNIILGGKEEDPVIFSTIQKNIAKTCILKPWDTNAQELAKKIINTESILKELNIFSLFVELNELPTIKDSYQKIVNLIDGDGEIKEIAKLIGSDPSMTAKLLRIANSAYYGAKSTSINQAVIFLGLKIIRELVISSSIFDVFNKEDVPEKIFQPLWQQSFLCSKIVNVLYKMLKKNAPDHASTAGLLANIGIIFLLKQFDQRYMRLLQKTKQLNQDSTLYIENFEKQEFDTTHSIIGGYLLNWWGIPFSIVEAVLYHHDPFNENVIDSELLYIVHIAEEYSSKTIYLGSQSNKVEDCFKMLGISKTDFENLITEI